MCLVMFTFVVPKELMRNAWPEDEHHFELEYILTSDWIDHNCEECDHGLASVWTSKTDAQSNERGLYWHLSWNRCTLMYPLMTTPYTQGPEKKHMYGWSETKAMYQSHDNERYFFAVSISNCWPLYLNGTLHNMDLANPAKSEDFISHRQSSYSI